MLNPPLSDILAKQPFAQSAADSTSEPELFLGQGAANDRNSSNGLSHRLGQKVILNCRSRHVGTLRVQAKAYQTRAPETP